MTKADPSPPSRPDVVATTPRGTSSEQHHRPLAELEAALAQIVAAPTEVGVLEMVVRRPDVDQREVLEEGQLSTEVGLVGDSWVQRSSRRTADGSPHPDMQLNIMSSRVLDVLTAGDRSRWAQAGDQLIVDLDLTPENLPPGTRLAVGEAVVEVTDQPHRGCAKFAARFGPDALRFVNTGTGAAHRLRGINAKVAQSGTVRPGDVVRKLPAAGPPA